MSPAPATFRRVLWIACCFGLVVLNGPCAAYAVRHQKVANLDAPSLLEKGKLAKLKQRETQLAALLAQIQDEKRQTLQSRPLTIGIVGFGRFGQFLAKTLTKHGSVVATSRSDYTQTAQELGVTYVSNVEALMEQDVDVIVLATSITSFESTVQKLAPYLSKKRRAPLIVDVLSVKQHARKVLLDNLPPQCDVLCTHPTFGPESGADGWNHLNFVYEKTRVNGFVFEEDVGDDPSMGHPSAFLDRSSDKLNMDRLERFLSIWEEEGCNMVPMSCRQHDDYAAQSQFVTHLLGRTLGSQGLKGTPIDTMGFQSVLKLVSATTADSFDLFYGLYKYNSHSTKTIVELRQALDEVVDKLQAREEQEQAQLVLTEQTEKQPEIVGSQRLAEASNGLRSVWERLSQKEDSYYAPQYVSSVPIYAVNATAS